MLHSMSIDSAASGNLTDHIHVMQVPLQLAIRETSDGGKPITAQAPDSAAAQIYTSIAEKIYQKLLDTPTQLQPPLLNQDSG